jgi:hypothetical protein
LTVACTARAATFRAPPMNRGRAIYTAAGLLVAQVGLDMSPAEARGLAAELLAAATWVDAGRPDPADPDAPPLEKVERTDRP